jgi:hypothetical protein
VVVISYKFMSFNRFTYFRPLALLCLSLFYWGALPAQAPLTVDRFAAADLGGEIKFEWRMESAARALQSGLSGVAETIYRSLLEQSAHLSSSELTSLKIGLAKALIEQGRFVAARAQLDSVPQAFQKGQYQLYFALSIYGEGEGQIDSEAFLAAFEKASTEGLKAEDLPWFAMLEGLAAELDGQAELATAAYQRARELTDQALLRSHFEGLIMRQNLLASPADGALVAELRVKIDQLEGQAAAYPFVREYAVGLYGLGRIGEAIGAIDRELENTSAGYDPEEREQLRLLKGIILGAHSETGRAALKTLILNGQNREALGIALQLLARVPDQDADLLSFLKVVLSRAEPHLLKGEMYYLRSQLAIKMAQQASTEARAGLMALAESDARTLLDQFPGLSQITNVYRLLAYAALERQPAQYRAAADFLIQMRDQSREEQDLTEVNRLIGDCYFLNQDFANAVDFYSAARSREVDSSREGELFLRLISAQVRAGLIEQASQLIDEANASNSIAQADRWRAEWNIAQAWQASGELDIALQRVRLLLENASPSTVPASLDIRLRWLESYLSLQAEELEGLANRVALLLARLDSMPPQQESGVDALTPEETRLLKTEILLLQGSAFMREDGANAGMDVLTQLRDEYGESTAALRSYLIEAAYHGLVGDFVSAQATMTKLAEIYPESPLAPQALFEAALYCERRGAEFYPQAIVLHNDLATRYASDPLFYFARLKQGNLLRSMNNFAGAQIVYENLINGFPAHEMRYIAELSRADCMLALAGNDFDGLADVVVILERLLDLPNLPLDFQAEAAQKWAFALIKGGSIEKAKEVLWLSADRFIGDGEKASTLGASGRYWLARSMLQLGEIFEKQNNLVEARKVYRQVIAYNLPGRHIAISRVDQTLELE